ncbi:glycosyl hydrolase family 28-related protein [Hymenobacter sp. GOD-10R]|uniref:glycosyl hydrolase family 28-related protein n=1 Tax=Hymenobacter sp. GOD-10R TaxID=3093922 RepID=UPI002D7765B2|nr:glycosyl hydrolase family 28-related protein [Hymenobacter sp. GOD-10R]WRQ26668.1 glycosyl hydrolase family 28-related protein [Hymenobacter sp. GOD-10R]
MAYTSLPTLCPGATVENGAIKLTAAEWLAAGLPDALDIRVAAANGNAAGGVTRVSRPTDLVIGAGQTLSADLAIFHHGESGVAGDNLSVQGAVPDGSNVYIARAGMSRSMRIVGKVTGYGQATYMIPTSFPLDLYEVWVGNTTQRSASKFINRARGLHFDSPEVVAGGTVRLLGKNLRFTGKTPAVRFVQGSTSVNASIDTSFGDAYDVKLNVPSSLGQGFWDVYYNNGLRSDQGEVKLPYSLQVIASTANPLDISVGWSHQFKYLNNIYNLKTDSRLTQKAVGDGVANDHDALQAAIYAARDAGGGVVYLPPGTYRINSNFQLTRNVILRGAGKTQTKIIYGVNNATGSFMDWETNGGGQVFGLMDLSIENQSQNGEWQYGLYSNLTKYVVLKNVSWNINLGRRLEMFNMDRFYIEGCEFYQGNTFGLKGYYNSFQLDGSRNGVWRNNKVYHATGCVAFNFSGERGGTINTLIEDSLFQRDGSKTWKNAADGGQYGDLVSHQLSMEFSRGITFQRNKFELINPVGALHINDGESIVAEQGANYQPDAEVGTVTSATATTLVDANKSWSNSFLQPSVDVVVAIVAGKGMGQWRTIVSRSGTTLTLASAWAIIPDGTSRYGIFVWGTRGWLVRGNTFVGNQRGIEIYYNATDDATIVDNVLTDSGSIDITPKQLTSNSTTFGMLPCYNIEVKRNTVSDTAGRMGVNIAMHPNVYVVGELFGNLAINYECRDNIINSLVPNTQAKIDDDFPNGYINDLFVQLAGGTLTINTPAILGSIFQNNTANNCANAYNLNRGAYNTVISGTVLQNIAANKLILQNNRWNIGSSLNDFTEARTI